MDIRHDFFGGYRDRVALLIGDAVLELIAESGDISRRLVAQMIEVLNVDGDSLAIDLALDVLSHRKGYGEVVKGKRKPGAVAGFYQS